MTLLGQGARYQMGIAIALVTVIPALALAYLTFEEIRSGEQIVAHRPVIGGILIGSVVLGYALLVKYPVNIVRLRRYLEDMVHGRMPEKVSLVRSMDDIRAIERAMNILLEQMSGRVAKMEQEVAWRREAERIKDDFVSTVSHELRTPLAIAKEGISLLLDRIPGELNAGQHKILATAGANIDRLARLINDLLDVSKIEAGKMKLHREATDLAGLVRQAAQGLRALAARKGIALDTAIETQDTVVYADPDRVMQVLTNLAGNAVKFTERGGVAITLHDRGAQVECRVSDTGIGIAPADMPRLFDKFTQFGRTDGAGEKGTGLGLTIVKNIVEMHGGEVSVRSEPGRGSTFAFTIPRRGPDAGLVAAIGERIAAAEGGAAEFSVFVFNLECRDAGTRASDVSALLRKGSARLLASRSLARGSDYVEVRGDRQIVCVADAGREDAALISSRWQRAIRECFEEEGAGLEVRATCACARYPGDGASPRALLDAAERACTKPAPAERSGPGGAMEGKGSDGNA